LWMLMQLCHHCLRKGALEFTHVPFLSESLGEF
jgi:hypothetical protein